MRFLLGTKKYMTEVFDAEGTVHPVTFISAAASKVTQVRTKETDGYSAIQIGFGAAREKNLSKPVKGHLKDLGLLRHLREFRVPDGDVSLVARGDTIAVSIFKEGDVVQVSAISKGKGFQGVVKRHGFGGGRRTHGQKHSEREPGAIGGGGRAGGRVAKGMRMAGRMGGRRVTVKNLKVVEVNAELNELILEGAVPGVRGALLEIRGT